MKNASILVVEDSITQAEALRNLLERQAANVETVPSAEAAIEWLGKANRQAPDLVLSDIMMPGMSGYELTKHIKTDERYQNIPVVLLTGLTNPLDIVRGLECGADNYVTKPYDPEYLVARLQHVLGQKRMRRGLRAALGVNVHFLNTTFTITSDREQILDLFLSSVEDVVRTNSALEQSQLELAEAQRKLEEYARHMAQRAETSAEHLRTVIESSPSAIIAVDLVGRVTLWNAAAERIFGFKAEEMMGKNLETVPSDRRGELEEMLGRTAQGGAARFETQRFHKDGSRIDVVVSLAALRDAHGRIEGHVAAVEDITERKRTAEKLARSQEQLVQAQKMEALGTLAGGVAHDFNNLLTVMRSYSSILLEELPADAEQHRRDAQEILNAADRAAALTSQLLSFSRKQVLQPRLVQVEEVISGIRDMLQRLLPANISLECAPKSIDATVRMDPGQLEQVLMNLVINASHAMPLGGVIEVTAREVKVNERRSADAGELLPGRHVRVTVTDSGSGMDDEVRAHLFEPFFTTKPEGTGTGLGLSIVHDIVTGLGGAIVVTSAPGKGTTFEIFLPAQATARADKAATAGDVPKGSEVILVVEDDPSVRAAVRVSLERFGYTVLDAADGAQALYVASMLDSPPHLVLTDMVMPEVSGRKLIRELKRAGPMPKVLIMSGYANDAAMRHELESQDLPFIQKPFTREALARKVREVLDSRGAGPKP